MKAIEKIPLQQIDLTDETFSVNFMPALQRLQASIEAVGLIHPVLLRKRQDRYQIVCGFRRITILKELRHPHIEAKVFEESENDDVSLFTLSLHENLTSRGFNPVEKAIALEKLVYLFQIDPRAVVRTFLPLFSLEMNEKILNTYLSLARMEEEVKRYVLKEEVSRSNIRRLSALPPGDRMAILSLFSSLKLGENSMREMVTLLEETSRRDRCGISEIVAHADVRAVLSYPRLTPSQRTERIKKVLLDLRYPRMGQMEKKFEEKKRALNLPFGVLIHHPPFFEGKGLRVGFQFETTEEYRSILSSLSSLADKRELEEMLQGKEGGDEMDGYVEL